MNVFFRVAVGSIVGLHLCWAEGNEIASYSPEQLGALVQKAENVLRHDTSAAIVSMEIKKEDYERQFDLLVLTDDRGDANKVLMKMLGPALWRGNVTLKVDNKITFYEPRNKRKTVMGNSMLTDNWMGSHFTNDDLLRETELAKHYFYKEISVVNRDGNQDIAIALTPKPDSPVSWGRVEYQLSVTEGGESLPLAVKYFKRFDDAVEQRTLTYSAFEKVGTDTVPHLLKMTIQDKPNEYTKIEYKKIKFNTDIPSSKFTEQSFE